MPMMFKNSRQRQFYHFGAQPRVSESSWAGWAPQPALRAGSQLGSLGCDCFAKPTLGDAESDAGAYYEISRGMTEAQKAPGIARMQADCARFGFTKEKNGTSWDDMCIGHMYTNKVGAFAPPAGGSRPSWVLPAVVAGGALALALLLK